MSKSQHSSKGILIVEDEAMVAQDIAAHLRDVGFEVAAIVHRGQDALDFLAHHQVRAIILDITLNGDMDGIAVAMAINSSYRLPIIFLTSHSDRSTLDRAKAVRPGAYLVKPFEAHDLLTSIEMALYNHSLLHPASRVLSRDYLNEHIREGLSQREFDIMMSMRSGKRNAELASEANVSINTIKTHLKNIYSKIGVGSRTELIVWLDELMH